MEPELSIVIPAYNEVNSIEATIRSIQAHLDRRKLSHEIIVAADGNDGTREKVAELGRKDGRLKVLGSADRGGKGRGIRMGIASARGKIVGFLDADNKVPIAEIDLILPWFSKGFDVVIGSRNVSDSRIDKYQPLYRQLGSRAFGFVMHAMVGLHGVRDTQCGFKYFRRGVAKDLFARQRINGYMFDVEILSLAERTGYRIKEVGIAWRDDGDSRLDLISGNLQNIKDLVRISLSRWRPMSAPVVEEVAAPSGARKAA